MIKYLVFGGTVRSKTDGDEHYINCSQLLALYKVNPADCRLCEGRNFEDSCRREALIRTFPKAIILRPQYDGNYDNHAELCGKVKQ